MGGDRGSDGRQKPEALSWGPLLIPSPGGRDPEGAGPGAGGAPRSSAHLSQPAQAQVQLRGSTQQPQPGPSHRPGGPRCPHTSSGFRVADPDRARGVQAARARPGRLTCSFLARELATPTGLGHTLRVARSFRPKYREISRGKLEYCGKGLTFLPQYSIAISKWI